MSEATIKYNGSTIASVDGGGSVTLATQGKYMSSNLIVEAAEGGGVVTRPVTIENSTYDNLYYTDASMMPIAVIDRGTDLSAVPIPVGSILVLVRENLAPPQPYPMEVIGIEEIDSYTIGSKGAVAIYKVQEA
jgi:hypothetical protein